MSFHIEARAPAFPQNDGLKLGAWAWRPVVQLIVDLCDPRVVSRCTYWSSNEGDGLDADDAMALATELEAILADGRYDDYAAGRARMLANLPPDSRKHYYDLDRETVEIVARFLKQSGGFEIN